MNLAIQDVSSATTQEWDTIWNACDHATYFHSREWAELWSAYTGGRTRPAPRVVRFSDSLRALLPLSLRTARLGLVRQYLSSPAGTFGGWLSADPLSPGHARLLVDHLVRDCGNLVWRLNPYDPLQQEVRHGAMTHDETQVVGLLNGFGDVKKRWTKGHSSAVRKASRLGVTVAPARDPADWHAYYGLYEASLERWGDRTSSRYRWRLFESLSAMDSPHVRLWLATKDDRALAGALCFYAKRHVVYWHGAALGAHFSLRPVHLLLAHVMEDACARGYAWFDFNPSGPHSGVRAFKAGFGPDTRACPVVTIEPACFAALRRARALLHAGPALG